MILKIKFLNKIQKSEEEYSSSADGKVSEENGPMQEKYRNCMQEQPQETKFFLWK